MPAQPLIALLAVAPAIQPLRGGLPTITGVAYDTRQLRPGELFVAVPGTHVDGHAFLDQAAARGAAAALIQADRQAVILDSAPPELPLLVTSDTRRALADVAAWFYDFPARKLRVIGVTGTDGKTTTTYLCSIVLEAAGYRTGFMGTVDFKVGDRRWSNDARQSTPESLDIQRLLAEMAAAGVDYAVIESTSHGLMLDRLHHCEFDAGVFTNLTSEHLDFHGTLENYRLAKARLFELVRDGWPKGVPKTAILNADDPSSAIMRAHGPARVLTYGVNTPADVRATDIMLHPAGSTFTAVTASERVPVRTGLTGGFNVWNALAALTLALSQDVPLATAAAALATVQGFPGRMERIDCGQPFTVIVDYAHTAESLAKVLQIGRTLTQGRVLAVFGSAGERDTDKRPKMGAVAAALADFFVLTNEDPRFEDAEKILDEIAAGARAAGRREPEDFVRIADRQAAIRAAFARAQPGDVVFLCGKGHERCIIIGDEKTPWDERAAARRALAELGYVQE